MRRTSEQFKAAKAFTYVDPSQPTVGEINQKAALGLPLFGWEKRILAMAGMRERLYEKQKHCEYCNCHLELEQATLDHKLPSSRGGLDEEGNLVICCKICNMLKDNMTVEEFLSAGRAALLREYKAKKAARKVDKKFKHINWQICYMKGPHLC